MFVDAIPSLTVMVMADEPYWLVSGKMVKVRFAPLPPKIKLDGSTRLVLELVQEMRSDPGDVSASPIVNPIGPVEVSSKVFTFVMPVIVGNVFTLTTADAALFVGLVSGVMDETTAVLVF